MQSCKKEGYTLDGQLNGISNGVKVGLKPFAMYDIPVESDAVVVDGKFHFEGKVPEPREYFLVVGEKQAFYKLMIENASMEFVADVDSSVSGDQVYYTLKNAKITGSESNDFLYNQLSVRDTLNKMYEDKNTKYAEVIQLLGKARVTKDQALKDSVEALEIYDAYKKAEDNFFKTVKDSYTKVIDANKDTYWGPLMMLNLYSYLTPENRAEFDAMSEVARNSHYGQMVKDLLYPANKEGENVPDFKTKDKTGNEYALNDLLKDKKVLLIDFWASWCGPCKKEIPNLKANYEKYKDKGFQIVSFSIDQQEKPWLKAVEDLELKWPNFRDLDVSSLYKVTAVPTMYLVDSEGKLIAENLRGEELTAKLAEIFGE